MRPPHKHVQFIVAFSFILAAVLLVSISTPYGTSQTSENLIPSTYQAFSKLAEVYAKGGQASELLAKLNLALEYIQQTESSQSKGDQAASTVANEKARTLLADLTSEISSAQQESERNFQIRALVVIASVPLVVLIASLTFYESLRVWRSYERRRLFGMKIVEKKIED
jgi:hypothetical protein